MSAPECSAAGVELRFGLHDLGAEEFWIDLRQELALHDPIIEVDLHVDDASRDLRANLDLVHRLDDARRLHLLDDVTSFWRTESEAGLRWRLGQAPVGDRPADRSQHTSDGEGPAQAAAPAFSLEVGLQRTNDFVHAARVAGPGSLVSHTLQRFQPCLRPGPLMTRDSSREPRRRLALRASELGGFPTQLDGADHIENFLGLVLALRNTRRTLPLPAAGLGPLGESGQECRRALVAQGPGPWQEDGHRLTTRCAADVERDTERGRSEVLDVWAAEQLAGPTISLRVGQGQLIEQIRPDGPERATHQFERQIRRVPGSLRGAPDDVTERLTLGVLGCHRNQPLGHAHGV